ncbi:unnamed protein product [Protopolystoma xenopodis]|uniref:Uncharacterized protein n=1 Tax=Protopolystoma xenopodis TaxID=117903 RepID=A0A3S5AET1_9PLAT|nr:unnamed protein product [Protopolystoma xenopodis]
MQAREQEKRRMEDDLAELRSAVEERKLVGRVNGYSDGDTSGRASFRSTAVGEEEQEATTLIQITT